MEIARRDAATAGLDDDYLPGPPPPHAQMSLGALQQELVKESILQGIIAAELESEARRELGFQHNGPRAVPLPLCLRAGLHQLSTLPHNGTSPVRQGGQLHLQMPMWPGPCLEEEGVVTPGGVPTPRRSVKDRIEEWYRPPWHEQGPADQDALMDRARLPKKTFSGMKRKRTAETSAANKKKSFGKWTCALCHVNTYSELSFEEHCAGYRHRSNVADLERFEETTEPKRIAIEESSHGMEHKPAAWNCSICQVRCSGELDLQNHLKGRRHQENVEALWMESKEIEGKNRFQEAKLYQKKEPPLVDMNQRAASGIYV